MTTVHSPLTAEDFDTQYDAEHRYMFIEHEYGDMLYTYGHHRDEEFARQATEFAAHRRRCPPSRGNRDRAEAGLALHLD